MKKIKKILALALLAGALLPALAAGSDVVVLMDASGTILPYFDEINNRVLVDITRKFVRQGDTFHLVSFNSRVNLEIVQPIRTEADISRVVSRFMLLYPLGQNSDFLSGINYTWQYVSGLDQQRDKIIIVISDGIFNPPPNSTYSAWTGEQVRTELDQVSAKIRSAGWQVYYIKLPFPQNAEIRSLDGNLIAQPSISATGTAADGTASGKAAEAKTYNDVSSDFTDALDIGQSPLPENGVPLTFVDSVFSLPEVTFPADLGKKGRLFTLPLKIKNTSDKPLNMELNGVFVGDTDVLEKFSFLTLSPSSRGTLQADIRLPASIEKGPQDLEFRLQFSGNLRVTPQSGIVRITLGNFSPEMLFRTGGSVFLVLILIGIALILVAALFFVIAKRTTRPASDAVRSAEIAAGAANAETSARTVQEQAAAKKTAQSGNASPAAIKTSPAAETGSPSAETGAAAAASLSIFGKEKRHLPVVLETAKNDEAGLFAKSLAAEQAAEKNERLAVLSSAAKKPEHHAGMMAGANANEPIAVRENTRVMLELHVHNQNPNVGKRNIHMMKAGSRLSLGGGSSPFLVFLVRFPPKIAEIRYDGKACSLAIFKPEYFPYESANIIHDCINRPITIVSDKAYELTFEMRIYEDPVTILNRILTSIKY